MSAFDRPRSSDNGRATMPNTALSAKFTVCRIITRKVILQAVRAVRLLVGDVVLDIAPAEFPARCGPFVTVMGGPPPRQL
jgi:hypothetical protein